MILFNTIRLKKIFASVSLLLTLATWVFSQNKLELDLSTTLKMAGGNNATITMLQSKTSLAEARYELAKNWWIPNVNAGIDMHQLWGNAMNTDGTIFQDIDRQSFGAGLGLGVKLDVQEGLKNKTLAKYKSRAQIFSSQIERNEFMLEVVEKYYRLLGASLEAASYQVLVNQSDSIITQLEVLVKEGLQYHTDLLLAKTNRENQRFQFFNAQNKRAALQAELLTLLFQDAGTQIVLKNTELIPVEMVKENTSLNLQAIQSTPDFKFLENKQAAKSFERKNMQRGIWIPKVELSAYSMMFGDVFKDILPTHVLNGGVRWEIPLSRLSGKDLKVLDLEKTILDQELSVLKNKCTQKVIQLQNQISTIKSQINSAEEAVNLSLLAVQESIQRQKLGLSRPFEIEQVQAAFIQSRINYLKSVVEYNVLEYRLWVLMGNDL